LTNRLRCRLFFVAFSAFRWVRYSCPLFSGSLEYKKMAYVICLYDQNGMNFNVLRVINND
ncbi:hypothetical protein MM710_36735, partial [Klebsiella pneumoniae]|nr:hypothetical protein [Klebsiella pneumoniae]